MRDRSEGRLGHGLAARSSRGGGPCAHQHGHCAQVGALTGGKVLGWSTTVTRQMHQARRAEVGLTEEVGRRWGGGKRPARWRSAGGQLWSGGDILGGGPAARGGGEGGDCGVVSQQRRKHDVGEKKSHRWQRQHPFKGGGGDTMEGGRGKSGDAWRGSRRGFWLPPMGDSSGGVAQPAAARPRRVRVPPGR
jgi:hypothetical protein